MKTSIAITIIITIAVFSYVSGYSISAHHKQEASYRMAAQENADNPGSLTVSEKTSAASGGYGSPSSEKAGGTSSPGYGTPSPGYGQ